MKYALFLSFLFVSAAYAWEGSYDDNGYDVEAEQENPLHEDEHIELYNYNDGEYNNVEVESISSDGSTVEIEAYDYDSDGYVIYEMDN